MCYGCWEERGKPQDDSPEVKIVADLIRKVYECSIVGGNLHIVIDDWNLDDASLQFCSNQINAGGYKKPNPDKWDLAMESTPQQLRVERECCDALLKLSETQRASALALYDGFWKP